MKTTIASIAALCAATAMAKNFNPIVPDWIADPSICKFGDTFYLYGTTDIDKELSRAGVPVVWRSKDFVNWSFEGSAIEGVDWDKGLFKWNDKEGRPQYGYYRYWAPGKVVKKGDKYLLYVTIVDPADRPSPTVCLESDKPEGPFSFPSTAYSDLDPVKDAVNGPLNRRSVKDATVAPDIDGDPFVDDDGTAYLVWRRRKAAKLDANWSKLEGPVMELPTKRGGYSEGPLMFKRNGLYYYLYTLNGCDSYMYGYMLSKEGPLSGWTAPEGDDCVISSAGDVWGPGHGTVFEDNGQYYFTYLEYGQGGTTRQVGVSKMDFNDDGTIKHIVPTMSGVGYLGPNQETRKNLALSASFSTSSSRPDSTTRGRANRNLARQVSYAPANAADENNGTRWMADGKDKTPWICCDLGTATKVSEVKVFFTIPAAGHNWRLEGSLDGMSYFTLDKETAKPCRSPSIAKVGKNVRFLKLWIDDGNPGIWELQIY